MTKLRTLFALVALMLPLYANAGVVRAGYRVAMYSSKEGYKVAKPELKVASYPARHPKKSAKALKHAGVKVAKVTGKVVF